MPAMGAGSEVLTQVGLLNRSGLLAKPIQYTAVKGALESIGEDAALTILGELQEKGGGVADPTAFIKEAAAQFGGQGTTSSASELDASVLRKLHELNSSGTLVKRINMSIAAPALASITGFQARAIVQALEDVGPNLHDPTGYIRAAVSSAGGTVPEGVDEAAEAPELSATAAAQEALAAEEAAEAFDDENPVDEEDGAGGDIARRVADLNAGGRLASPIMYSDVKDALLTLGPEGAATVLQELEDAASSIRDPAKYIKLAVQREGKADNRIFKAVVALNNKGVLATALPYGVVRFTLENMGVVRATKVLKDLEEQGASVEDPVRYIQSVARGVQVKQETGAKRTFQVKYEPGAKRRFVVTKTDLGAKQAIPGSDAFAAGFAKGKGKGAAAIKSEDLADMERIKRRVHWLNKNGNLEVPIKFADVAEDLNSVGAKQAMRILHNLTEAGPEVQKDPKAFVLNAVCRSGWIWSDSYTIDEDERVAKRVAWMNKYAGLKRPIEWGDVAALLDGLKVAHAMTMLKELEMEGPRIANPTEYIKKMIESTGADDEVEAPAVDDGEEGVIAARVSWLNDSGILATSIEYAEVADSLMQMGEDRALSLLADLESKGKGVKDPTNFLRFKLRAQVATLGGPTVGAGPVAAASDVTAKIAKRIEWLNDFGGLATDISLADIMGPLEAAGLHRAMEALNDLEERGKGVKNPSAFIRSALKASAASDEATPDENSATRIVQVPRESAKAKVTWLNAHGQLKKPIRWADVSGALDSLGTRRSIEVLRQLQEEGLGIADPTHYIKVAASQAFLAACDEDDDGAEDDVTKIARRLNWLNKYGSLSKPIKVDDVVGALYCLGLPMTMSILKGLQEKAASVDEPTWYIKVAVQRANGKRVTPPMRHVKLEPAPAEANDDEEMEEAEEDDAEAEWGKEVDDEEEDENVDMGADDQEGNLWPVEIETEMEAMPVDTEEPAAPSNKGRVKIKVRPSEAPRPDAPKRVVGALTGYGSGVPNRRVLESDTMPGPKGEDVKEHDLNKPWVAPLPVTPAEKQAKCRDVALEMGLKLDDTGIMALARLPFYRAKDVLDEVLLGGKNRKGVANPSRYVVQAVAKMTFGLGVEQGINMEFAVSVGVLLNNEALDELASIPRAQAKAVILEIAQSEEAKVDPLDFIKTEVGKRRAVLDARAWPVAT